MNHRIVKILILFAAFMGGCGVSFAAGDDIDAHRSCDNCGMDRKAYGFSRMLIVYADGGEVGVCSLHCAVVELDANRGRTVKALFVADRDTGKLVAAARATWVMGGSKRGVMTPLAKWAFENRGAAEAFIASYGGNLVSWEEAVGAARKGAAPKAP